MEIVKKPHHVYVNAFGRIHLGFLDLNGQSGRRFGSLGVSLSSPETFIELAIGKDVFSSAPAYVEKAKNAVMKMYGVEEEVSVQVHQEIPRHFGLGSGTQMALAIGAGVAQLFDLKTSLQDIAIATNRGKRSGIGIGTFAEGGIVLDGGRGSQTKIPPILMQHAFPADWRILLVFDHDHIGVHGAAEVEAFETLKDASVIDTQQVNQAVLMKLLPSIKEADYQMFSEGVAALQAYTGRYFAPAQGGQYASKKVAHALGLIQQQGVQCIGQSSWGPTGFAIIESAVQAEQLIQALEPAFQQQKLSWQICEARNAGAEVNT